MNTQPHEPTGLRNISGRITASMVPIFVIGWMLSTSGCAYSPYLRSVLAPYDTTKCEALVAMRASSTARSLWRQKYAHCYGANSGDIKRGFIDGFVDTALGGDGCTPLVPPNRCIGRKLEAQCWFQGYPLGVVAAESSGACNWCKATVSPELMACIATPTCTPGCIPCEQSCGCGNPNCDGSCGIPAQAPIVHQSPLSTADGMIIQEPISDQEAESMPAPEAAIIEEPRNTHSPTGDEPPAPVMDSVPNEAGSSSNVAPPAADAAVPEPLSAPVEPVPAPTEAIERAIDGSTQVAPETEANAAPIKPSPEARATQTKPTSDVPEIQVPIVGEPVEMPNLQVSFNLSNEDWLFGDIDIARALLEQDVPNVWSAE